MFDPITRRVSSLSNLPENVSPLALVSIPAKGILLLGISGNRDVVNREAIHLYEPSKGFTKLKTPLPQQFDSIAAHYDLTTDLLHLMIYGVRDVSTIGTFYYTILASDVLSEEKGLWMLQKHDPLCFWSSSHHPMTFTSICNDYTLL